MHDCNLVESKLLDLVFDETGTVERQPLLAEIENCPNCLSEYRSLTGTLLMFDTAAEATQPAESYWPEHHEALCLRLEQLAPTEQEKPISFWRRLLSARLPVPIPVAALIVIAFLFASAQALRSSNEAPRLIVESPPAPIFQTETRIVEVPVIREKFITTAVYPARRANAKNEERPQPAVRPLREAPFIATNAENETSLDNSLSRAGLNGFQPPDEMRIRVIRRNSSDEK